MRSHRPGSELLRHAVCLLITVILFIVVPAVRLAALHGDGTDAVSSATTILEQPSGAYVVFVNRNRHTNADKLDTWIKFFSGEETDYIFEDISCIVSSADKSGWELAESFQSRLPENQMKLRTEDATLFLSKVYYGEFDVAIMSREAYRAYGAEVVTELSYIMPVMSGDE
ncbi:MAG: hypothetical protein K5929_07260 [Lachnospiraceae bacterium]|nr:hypothetical protein [Lachnospiraceae bacterium]